MFQGRSLCLEKEEIQFVIEPVPLCLCSNGEHSPAVNMLGNEMNAVRGEIVLFHPLKDEKKLCTFVWVLYRQGYDCYIFTVLWPSNFKI
jgi:hypothetical protein